MQCIQFPEKNVHLFIFVKNLLIKIILGMLNPEKFDVNIL